MKAAQILELKKTVPGQRGDLIEVDCVIVARHIARVRHKSSCHCVFPPGIWTGSGLSIWIELTQRGRSSSAGHCDDVVVSAADALWAWLGLRDETSIGERRKQ